LIGLGGVRNITLGKNPISDDAANLGVKTGNGSPTNAEPTGNPAGAIDDSKTIQPNSQNSGAGALLERDIVGDLLFGARVGEGLPGSSGSQILYRPTSTQLDLLTAKHNVEFAVTYKMGPGPNGGGGQYFLHSGKIDSVTIPLEPDRILITHTHPGGTAYASQADQNLLKTLELLGSPQRSSQVIPSGGTAIRFNKSSNKL
jgi:hypothetical protein